MTRPGAAPDAPDGPDADADAAGRTAGRPAALDWILVQLALLVAVASIAWAFGALPELGYRAGWIAGAAGLAAAVAVLRWPAAAPTPPGGRASMGRPVALALAAAVAVAWAVRAVAATASDVPLGYDYGFYKAAFDAYAAGDLPLRTQPDWMAASFEPGLPALHAVLQGVAGLSAQDHLRHLHPLLAALNALFAFVAARAYAGTRAGLLAAGLMAASSLQLEAHAYLYEKNLVALGLLLVAAALLRRRAWVACGVLLGAVGAWHRPTLLLAALGFAAAVLADPSLRRAWSGWARTAGVAVALFLPLWLALPDTFLAVGRAVAEGSGQAIATPGGQGSGTFYGTADGLRLMAPYLPLALAGAAAAWRWPSLRAPAALFAVALAYVALELPLNRRFLLMADAAAVVVAGAALAPLAGSRGRATAVAAACLVLAAGLGAHTLAEPSQPHRWMTEGQWAQLPALRDLPAGATLVADNLRAPYVLAEAGHRTYGPGLLDDPHNRTDWGRFWSGLEGERLRAFMAPYGDDVYMVQVEEPGPDWGASSLREPEFTVVHDEGGLRVWRYEGTRPGTEGAA